MAGGITRIKRKVVNCNANMPNVPSINVELMHLKAIIRNISMSKLIRDWRHLYWEEHNAKKMDVNVVLQRLDSVIPDT